MRSLMSRKDDEAGFTLVELLVVVVILGVVGGYTLTGLVQGMRTADRVEARADALAELERAGQRVARELRRAVWSNNLTTSDDQPRGCTVPAVTAQTESTLAPDDLSVIVFHSDERFRYRYTYTAGELRLDEDRWDGSSWIDVADRVVIDELTNATHGIPVFTYVGADGKVLPLSTDDEGDVRYTNLDIAKVEKIRLRLRLDVRGEDPMELTTMVSPRNGVGTCPVLS